MDDILARQVPHSLEAEQAVLGSMLIDSRCVNDLIGMVRPDDFYFRPTAIFTRRSMKCSATLR